MTEPWYPGSAVDPIVELLSLDSVLNAQQQAPTTGFLWNRQGGYVYVPSEIDPVYVGWGLPLHDLPGTPI